MNDSLENCEIERCNVSEPLNAYVCKESRRDKYKITKQRRHRRIRDREPSRIPVRRVLRKLKKRTTRHRLKSCVLNSFPCTSFINCLCKNYKNLFLWYNTEHCYFKYVSFMMVYNVNQYIRMVAVTEMYIAQFPTQSQLLDILIFLTMAQH